MPSEWNNGSDWCEVLDFAQPYEKVKYIQYFRRIKCNNSYKNTFCPYQSYGMRPVLLFMLLGLLFGACASMPNFQKTASKTPCIGAIGNDRSTLFKKEFQKVGEPSLIAPISVSLNSYAFTKSSFGKYHAYTKNLGKTPKVAKTDSIAVHPRFFTLKITDLVLLQSAFNHPSNTALKNYMATDSNLSLLNEISFVTTPDITKILENAHHFYINDGWGTVGD